MYNLQFSQSLNKGVFPIAHIHESANLNYRVSIPNFVSKAEKQIWDRKPGYKTTHLHPFPTWKAATLRPCWTGHSCARKWKRICAMDLALAPPTHKKYKCSHNGKCCDSVQSTHVHHTLGLDGISGIWVHDIGNKLLAKWGQIRIMYVGMKSYPTCKLFDYPSASWTRLQSSCHTPCHTHCHTHVISSTSNTCHTHNSCSALHQLYGNAQNML